ncbi:metal-dependent hydrolase [Variovorax boronicumulans]|uniref:metal-dependent hydrolase n=1 Tax=Variovorax boronicumulans TaxID=436515 RepID=UPI001C56B596
MTDLVVRRLLIDLKPPFARDWCGGDAFSSAVFNALSMSFPYGEQFFIDAVRDTVDMLAPELQARHKAEVKGFIGQEATHRRIHALFNEQLERQGLVDHWTPRAMARMKTLEGNDPRHALAITAATEHFTAMFADWLLAHPQVLDGAEPRLRTMWFWHSAEESEHKNTAFDLYAAAAGSQAWRTRWFRRVTMIFLTDLARQTVTNLRHEGQLWKLSTWRSAARILLGRDGLLRSNLPSWRAYFRADFHPSQHDSDLAGRWLADNAAMFEPVNALRPAAS